MDNAPELKLKDDDVASRVTVLQLLNHTVGWKGDLMDKTGDGDGASRSTSRAWSGSSR